MVFLALLLRERTYSIHEMAGFRIFEESSSRLGDGQAVANMYSAKAAKYACQCLQALGMTQPLGGDEFALTELGKELLDTGKLQARYATYSMCIEACGRASLATIPQNRSRRRERPQQVICRTAAPGRTRPFPRTQRVGH